MAWDEARRLGSAFVIQPKMDGIYVEVETDAGGRVVSLRSRSGRTVGNPGRDIVGARIAAGAGVFAGELESHTEAGLSARQDRGFAQVHLFDALQVAGRDLSALPYRIRRDALLRSQSAIATPDHANGRRRHGERLWRLRDGTYSRGPMDWRVAPVVPQHLPGRADALWGEVMSDLLEGLVVVALDAPLGARRAKRKVKRTDALDCVVLEAGAKRCTVRSFGKVFAVGCSGLALQKGDVVEVCYNGEYRDGTPRFPRIKRRRDECLGARPSSSTTSAAAFAPA